MSERRTADYWFRSEVEIPRLFEGSEIVANWVQASGHSYSQARSRARYKVFRAAREAGFRIGFQDIKLTCGDIGPIRTEGEGAEAIIW